MKKSRILVAILAFIGLTAFGQTATESKTVTGKITKAQAFNDECAVTVDGVFLVLIKDPKDATGHSFEINAEYKDLIVRVEDAQQYEVAHKYAKKKFKVTYYINGKGWKCIEKIEPVK